MRIFGVGSQSVAGITVDRIRLSLGEKTPGLYQLQR